MNRFPQSGLDRLAERVVGGEVVFFVGAGFSIDSEGNTAQRLIGRLLARFDAMTSLLAGRCLTPLPAVAVAARARELRQGLSVTFAVEEIDGYLTTPTQAATLAREYYTINDWLASAFSLLLGEIRESERLPNREQFLIRLSKCEQFLLADRLGERPPRLSPITPEDLERLLALPDAHCGKALFLETMGFADRAVMAGLPCDLDLDTVEESYAGRLLPRHRVLAWLAREGLAPALLTTNFDLLLEGAYRLAGLTPRFARWDIPQPLQVPQPVKGAPPATFDFFLRITSATEFFGRGDDRRSAQLLKIHGCAESYRWVRDRAESVQGYLPAVVFTFREIQNWREDSWSRDLLSTLLRTRTIVFCGYSGADPVLHDTIRTVYEEMARRRSTLGLEHTSTGVEAPAFFLGSSGKTEFHGMEILRAASRAAGGNPGLTDHLNYLRFHFPAAAGTSPFPLLDEVMRWLFHLAFRRRQYQALEGDLGRVATVLLGHPCPEVERGAVLEEFEALRRAEEAAAAAWDEQPGHRLQFDRMVGWIERFQVRLLREFALADAVLRSSGPGLELDRLRRSQWYYPALDHTDWAAWGAVVELALRRRIAAWQKVNRWEKDNPWLSTAPGSRHPALLYARGASSPTPSCMTVRLLPPGGRDEVTEHRWACRRHRAWELDYSEIPWRRKEKGSTPGAEILWQWAHRPLAEIAGGQFEQFL
jgi:hypothetical protein